MNKTKSILVQAISCLKFQKSLKIFETTDYVKICTIAKKENNLQF